MGLVHEIAKLLGRAQAGLEDCDRLSEQIRDHADAVEKARMADLDRQRALLAKTGDPAKARAIEALLAATAYQRAIARRVARYERDQQAKRAWSSPLAPNGTRWRGRGFGD
ncbi:MAG: hypothetical protein AB7Y46_08045 [Armatimonadota bacterium]